MKTTRLGMRWEDAVNAPYSVAPDGRAVLQNLSLHKTTYRDLTAHRITFVNCHIDGANNVQFRDCEFIGCSFPDGVSPGWRRCTMLFCDIRYMGNTATSALGDLSTCFFGYNGNPFGDDCAYLREKHNAVYIAPDDSNGVCWGRATYGGKEVTHQWWMGGYQSWRYEKCETLVFEQNGVKFRCTAEGDYVNSHDRSVRIDAPPYTKTEYQRHTPILIADIETFTPEELQRWCDLFMDYELMQPFPQLLVAHLWNEFSAARAAYLATLR